jgi:hypothetical protein
LLVIQDCACITSYRFRNLLLIPCTLDNVSLSTASFFSFVIRNIQRALHTEKGYGVWQNWLAVSF